MSIWMTWVSDLALKHEAVIISPNYRLMPEALSKEIYEDVEDLWTWVHSSTLANLLAVHSTPAELDLDRILTAGGSAGGSLSLYLALAHPDQIRAATASYPGVDMSVPAYTEPRNGPVWGFDVPESAFEKVMSSASSGSGVSSVSGPDRLAFMIACIQHGNLGKLYQRETEGVPPEFLYPLARLEKTRKVPRGGVCIFQGRQDSVIPASETEKFVARAKELTSDEDVTLVVREGEHGFDLDARLDDQWVADALEKAIRVWLE